MRVLSTIKQLRYAESSFRKLTSVKPARSVWLGKCPTMFSRTIQPMVTRATMGSGAMRQKSSFAIVDEYNSSQHRPELDTNSNASKPFLLTDIGEGIHEVEILQWFVSPGDVIAQFDKVCEVQSDKATVEITSRYDGVVEKLCGDTGEMVKVGSPLLFVLPEGMENDDPSVPPSFVDEVDVKVEDSDPEVLLQTPQAVDVSGDKFSNSKSKVLATPAVRRLSMEYNLDLSSFEGSGKGGRVLKSDILQDLKQRGMLPNDSSSDISVESQGSLKSDDDFSKTETIAIRGYSRIMAKAMETTLQVPLMVYSDEVDVSALKKCREDLKVFAESKGVRISYLPFAIKATSLAMKDYPIMNSSIDMENMTLKIHANHDIGIAIDSPNGLIVPVIKNCQDLSVLDIALELNRLRDAVDQGTLSEEDLSAATFSLSNIGSIGGTVMSPVVLPPQVAIGAMGKIQRLPRFVGNSMEVEEAHLMSISWGGDHRVLDGGTLGRFSNAWKSYIEKPMSMAFTLK